MKCPQCMLDFINKYEFPETDKFEMKRFIISLYRTIRGWAPIFKTRMLFQKIFRHYHLSDLEIWGTDTYMAARMLKHLRVFKKHDRMGYPSDFTDSHESFSCSEEEYEQMIEDGTIIGGGSERWEAVLDHIIMSLEYIAEIDDAFDNAHACKWWNKHFGFSPYDKLQVNEYIRWVKKQDLEDGLTFMGKRENPNDESYTRHVSYLNIELITYAESVVQAGLMQLAIYFRSLWD